MKINGINSIRLNNSLHVNYKSQRPNEVTQPSASDTVSFTSKSKLLPKNVYPKLETAHEQALIFLIKAEKDAKNFESNGKKFGNASNHILITSPVIKNKDGEDCWLEFSSSEQYLSYGEYGPLRIKVEGGKQGITAARRLSDGDIDYVTVTPNIGYEKDKYFEFIHTETGSCGSGHWNLGKKDRTVTFDSQKEQIEAFQDTVNRFLNLMNP